jgi:8-oxo-dGTP diphosphatase
MDLAQRQLFALATDLVVFAFDGDALRLLLVRRGKPPFEGLWALPGGFLEHGETLEDCARRELREETGVELRRLDQLSAFSAPGRDPRGNVVSIAYVALVRADGTILTAASDAAEAAWQAVDALPKLAFDHDAIIGAARQRLAEALYTTTAAFDLLPDNFTLAEAQTAFERMSGMPIDKRNFRSWLRKEDLLRETGQERRGQHRPAKLYQLDHREEPPR